jgi:hypothetical protein
MCYARPKDPILGLTALETFRISLNRWRWRLLPEAYAGAQREETKCSGHAGDAPLHCGAGDESIGKDRYALPDVVGEGDEL